MLSDSTNLPNENFIFDEINCILCFNEIMETLNDKIKPDDKILRYIYKIITLKGYFSKYDVMMFQLMYFQVFYIFMFF